MSDLFDHDTVINHARHINRNFGQKRQAEENGSIFAAQFGTPPTN